MIPVCGRRVCSVLGLAVVLAPPGCIVPDIDIDTETVRGNPGAVRIVERTNLSAAFLASCTADATTTCPQVPSGRRSGLVVLRDPDTGLVLPYCTCSEGARDTRVVPEFFIYAEDPDRSGGEPTDTLYAVALLDLDPLGSEPQASIAYDQQFEPGRVGEPFRLEDLEPEDLAPPDLDPEGVISLLFPSDERENNGLFRFRFGKNNGGGTDLCNDDNGKKLEPGVHTLQIMVTDRRFFRPPLLDAAGEQVVGLDGHLEFGTVQYGMPDIASGATWSIANYVFECVAEDPDLTAVDSKCACAPVEGV